MKTKNINLKRIFTSTPFIVCVFLLVFAGFGMVYFQKHAQYQDLQSQITLNGAALQKPRPDLKGLEERLRQVEAQLKEKQAPLPNSEQGIEIVDTLVEVAQMSKVEVMSVKGAPPIEPKDKSTTTKGATPTQTKNATTTKGATPVQAETDVASTSILPFTIMVQGTQGDILTFISNLTGSPEILKSSEVKNVNIEQGELDQYTAELDLYIYVQPKASP